MTERGRKFLSQGYSRSLRLKSIQLSKGEVGFTNMMRSAPNELLAAFYWRRAMSCGYRAFVGEWVAVIGTLEEKDVTLLWFGNPTHPLEVAGKVFQLNS